MDVPYAELKAKLIGYGFLEDHPDLRPSFWTPALGNDRKFVSWMREPEEIRKALSTDCPAVALWSCHLYGKEKLGDAVFEMTKSSDDMLRLNAGIALGVMHDERAKPILREIIRDRKPFFFMDCRRSNQMRSVIAICLEGQMADAEITDELLNITGVDASIVAAPDGKGGSFASARSIGDVNVQLIMEALGGGGNRSAAAAQFADTGIDEAVKKVYQAIDDYLS